MIKKISSRVMIIALLSFFAFAPLLTYASTFDQIIGGFGKTGKSAGYDVGDNGVPKKEFIPSISDYINAFFIAMGGLFMVLIIYAGWLWLSARGNEDQVGRAKTMVIQAVIGLAIIIAGRLIAELVITYLGQVIK